MSLWSNTDAAASAPKYNVAGGLGVSANGQVLFDNTTADAYVTGAKVGVFGVSTDEKTGTGNVASLTIVSAGSGFTARPTLLFTGANTTQATATANAGVVGVTINTAGTGYAVGNTFTTTGGTGTAGVLTVTTVDTNGNVTGVSITTVGDYTVLPTLTANPFTSNTGSGTGFTANLSMGISSTVLTNVGEGYSKDTIAVTVGGAGGTGSTIAVALTGQEGTNGSTHSGWVLRKEGTGGRAGRVQYETLVAMGSMTEDGDDDSVLSP